MYLGGEEVRSRPYAEHTQRIIDVEVGDLLRQAEQRATALLTQHRNGLDRLVAELLVHETVDGDVVALAVSGPVVGAVPAEPRPAAHNGVDGSPSRIER
jgi:cell division protease FtsH